MSAFDRIWNGRLSGLLSAVVIGASIVIHRLSDKVATFLWKGNLQRLGSRSLIQRGVVIRNPGRVSIGSDCSIASRCSLASEFVGSTLCVGDGVIINSGVHLDFSGGLSIGNRTVISENVMLFTHSHGRDPHSFPMKTPLVIGDEVWIGANATICEGVGRIASNSVIAAGAVLTHEVTEPGVYGGVPAKRLASRRV